MATRLMTSPAPELKGHMELEVRERIRVYEQVLAQTRDHAQARAAAERWPEADGQ